MDVFSDGPTAQPSLGPTPEEAFLRYLLSLSYSDPPPSVWILLSQLPFAVLSQRCVSVHSSFSPSSCLSFPGPLAASLGLAACHTCLLCLLWDWMAQRAGAPCP